MSNKFTNIKFKILYVFNFNYSILFFLINTYLCQTCHSEAEGKCNVHNSRCILPRDAGGAAYEDQQERAQNFGEQHHQEVELGDLLKADKLLDTCKRKSKS